MEHKPIIHVRRSTERGHANHEWLNTYHTFSFGDYHDANHMSFRTLRVINEDTVAPGEGFGSHPHKDMEIITIVLAGALEHEDSIGNSSVIKVGDVQRMSAGRGVIHSEFNHSTKESVHFYQVWIFPEEKGVEPSYEQKSFSKNDLINHLCLIVSDNGVSNSLKIQQDVKVYQSILDAGKVLNYETDQRRGTWIQVHSGQLKITDEVSLTQGDGASIENIKHLKLEAQDKCHFLLFDLF